MRFYGLDVTTRVGTWISGWPRDPRMPAWEDLFQGRLRPEGPLEVDIIYPDGGEKPPDCLGIGGAMKAVSPRMLQVLESIQATGYRTQPVILRHPLLGMTIHGYTGLLVHGSGGPLDEDRSKPHWSSTSGGLIGCDGFYIYRDRWDGSDFFRIERAGYAIWITERVAEALQKVKPKLRNLELTPNTSGF